MNEKDFKNLYNLLKENLYKESPLKRDFFTHPALSLILNVIDEKDFSNLNTKDNYVWKDSNVKCEIYRNNKKKYTPLFIAISYLFHRINGNDKETFSIPLPLPVENHLQLRNTVHHLSMTNNLDWDINLTDFLIEVGKRKKVDLYSIVKMYYAKLEKENKEAYENNIALEEDAKNEISDEVLIKQFVSNFDQFSIFKENIKTLKHEFNKLVNQNVFGDIPPHTSDEKLFLCISEYMECVDMDLVQHLYRKLYREDMDYFATFAQKINQFIDEIDLRYVSLTDKILMAAPLIAFRTNVINFYPKNYLENDEYFAHILGKKGIIQREFQIRYIQAFYDKIKGHSFEEKANHKLLKIIQNFSEFAGLYSNDYKTVMPKSYSEESLNKILQTKL